LERSVRRSRVGRSWRCGLALGTLFLATAGCAESGRSAPDAGRISVGADESSNPIETPVNTCERRHIGESPDTVPADWRERSVLVGDAGVFPDVYADQPPTAFDAKPGEDPRGVIIGVVVRAGGTALIGIADANVPAFLNDLVAFHPPGTRTSARDDAVTAMRLEACPDRDTMFGLAMFVLGPRCVPVDVSSPYGLPSTRVSFSFGSGACTEVAPRMTG
jgi:hypothetical protein